MAVYQLENEHIYLEVASHGAELVRLVGKKTKRNIYLMEIQSTGSVTLQSCFRLSAV